MIDLPIIQDNGKYFAVGSQGSPLVSIQAGINSDIHTVPALIDTGADFVFAEPDWLRTVQAPIIGSTAVNGQSNGQIHMVTLIIPGHRHPYTFRVIARAMPERDYTFVLGRSFLKYCSFHYNGPTNRHRLTFHPDAIPENILLL